MQEGTTSAPATKKDSPFISMAKAQGSSGSGSDNLLKAPTTQKRSTFLPLWIISIVVIVLIIELIPHGFWTFITFRMLWLQIIGAACLIIFTGFTLWARWSLEERLLKETFGEQYVQYQQHVPQLVPGLKLLTRYQ